MPPNSAGADCQSVSWCGLVPRRGCPSHRRLSGSRTPPGCARWSPAVTSGPPGWRSAARYWSRQDGVTQRAISDMVLHAEWGNSTACYIRNGTVCYIEHDHRAILDMTQYAISGMVEHAISGTDQVKCAISGMAQHAISGMV